MEPSEYGAFDVDPKFHLIHPKDKPRIPLDSMRATCCLKKTTPHSVRLHIHYSNSNKLFAGTFKAMMIFSKLSKLGP